LTLDLQDNVGKDWCYEVNKINAFYFQYVLFCFYWIATSLHILVNCLILDYKNYTLRTEKNMSRDILSEFNFSPNRFSKFFHCWTSIQRATNHLSYFPPHLKSIATLPCEIPKIKLSKLL